MVREPSLNVAIVTSVKQTGHTAYMEILRFALAVVSAVVGALRTRRTVTKQNVRLVRQRLKLAAHLHTDRA